MLRAARRPLSQTLDAGRLLSRTMASEPAPQTPTRLPGAPNPPVPKPTGLVMQIILRRDLVTELGWPMGPMMAQAAHAASAVQHEFAEHPDMKRYLAGDDGLAWMVMRKAVLEVPDWAALRALAFKLDEAGFPAHLWMEEPEHTPTALALVPNKRPKALKKILDEAGVTLWK
ncbi:Putative peptidyl-tRNA hydrolase PTRHD1 [Vanrija pseudolonga]|uniref:peptidyl-tRNA hydrolase n=1 Tax=Vanrija pseudolonga TaxID=143232 RepID=A0AAF1BKN0_9TREE|nr:Putative peptidyl-tRNA hydrolase PTRHD1 [Vanrija pseudolonga]